MADIPVISSHILDGLPAFIRREMGEKTLLRAKRAIGLDLEMIEGRNCFIPHAAVIGFLDATGRAAGEANFGALTRISHTVEVHRGSESEKVVLREQLGFDRGAPRCKQSV